jgi:protein-glutamine gamma-glutamyltransferase
MNLEGYFRVTSYGLVATAFLALALTGELDAVSILLYPVVFGVSFYADARGIVQFRLREWMWRVLAIVYVPFIFLDAAFISDRVLALVHMTLFLSAAKLTQNKRDRDWVFLYLVAFFQMLLAAGLTFNAIFVASLGLFLFFFVSTLAAFEIRRARTEVTTSETEIIPRPKKRRFALARAKESAPKPPGRVRYLVGASFAQIIMVAALTLPFFFLIPRLGGGDAARGLGLSKHALTGFSETVRLGEVASIKKSQRVVMRVELDRQPDRLLRWRGVALDLYDGRGWSLARFDNDKRFQVQDKGMRMSGETVPEAAFNHTYKLGDSAADGRYLIEQQITLEPFNSTYLFATRRPVALFGPISSISIDTYTGAVSASNFKGRRSYRIHSDIKAPTEQELRLDSDDYPDTIKRLYLKLPDLLDPRIRQLAHEHTRNAPTPYDKAREIEKYLKTQFEYSLAAKPTQGDPLAEFLFETHEGHCEYFATAMAVMLRTLGIPARIVNGFQMGEYNYVNNLYTVRESDAHSWVEVYFSHANTWVEFDPTPAAGLNDYSQGGLGSRLRKYLEAAEVFWLDYVVTLDGDEQASIMVELQQKLIEVKNRFFAYYLAVKQWFRGVISWMFTNRRWSAADILEMGGLLGLVLLSLLGLYVGASYFKRRHAAPTGYGPWWHRVFVLPMWRRRRLKSGDHRASAVLFYEQMLAIAARAGLIKEPSQTPLEFAANSGYDEIRQITDLYNRVRFGGARLADGEVRRLSLLLAELKRAARKKK